MAGLIEVTGRVMADVFVHQDTGLPVRFIIVQPESVSETEPDPTTWTIDVYDFDQPGQLDEPPPAPESTPEATPDVGTTQESPLPESTSESTPEGTPAS
jgi:hypothetical protein